MTNQFSNFSLKGELLHNLEQLNFTKATPIQEKAIPLVLEGKDLIAQAKTGSGKTAAFGLGILNSLYIENLTIKSLILCPTRELAEQVAAEMRTLARTLSNIKILTICGGVAEIHQDKSLSHGAHIIIGTPGRVLKLLKKRTLDLSQINTLVLDEADKMLDMGFHQDIMHINVFLPPERQTLLFSATFPEEIEELSSKLQKDVTIIKVDTEHAIGNIEQTFYKLSSHKDKNEALLRVLDHFRPDRFIVFCKTKQISDNIAKYLNRNGVVAAAIHGDLLQNERTVVMSKFKNRSLNALVATDVAARGLDIQELTAVINYDLPPDPEVYTHRIGRTGRAGKNGHAFSFFVEQEEFRLEEISEFSGSECVQAELKDLKADKNYDLHPPMKTMYIGGGKKQKLRPGDILGALVGAAKISPDDVGDISILNIVSYVAINSLVIDRAVSELKESKIKNRKFKVGLA